jgi:hypothetical protein
LSFTPDNTTPLSAGIETTNFSVFGSVVSNVRVSMTPISQRAKELANSLAESSRTEDGSRLLRQLRMLLQLTVDELLPLPSRPGTARHRIGIWERERCGAEYRFVRPAEPCEQASLWANVGAIEPKGRRKRVVLIGESVARGFFFDPHFNPTIVLQHMLREGSGDHDIEVVDLARTDLTMGRLLELAVESVQLTPDVVVVLAGNNWQPTIELPTGKFRELADRLRRGNWAEVKSHLEGLLVERARATIHSLCGLAQANRFKLVFVLPEFNLVDWRTDAISPPLLESTATADWHALRARAEDALAVGDAAEAEVMGHQLIAMDKGTTAVGFNLIAEGRLKAGDIAEARKYLEAARDSAICWPNGPESPRCFTVVQNVVRKEATKSPFFLVDLPRVIQSYLQGGLPDHRVFLDYCHFNIAGTHIAMAAVSQVVLAAVYKLRRSLGEVNAFKVAVDPRVEGEAHFLAAIHNANWGQRAQLVRMHCDKALELAPSLYGMLGLFLDTHIRRTPSSLCRAFDELCEVGGTSAVSLLFDSARPTAENFLNPTLIHAVTDALNAHQVHVPATQATTEELLCQEHGIDTREVNLLDTAYSADSYLMPLDQSARAFFRASGPISRFKVIWKGPEGAQVRLTCRTGWESSEQRVTVRVCGREVGDVPLSKTWRTSTFTIPSEALSSGINVLEIHWPAPRWDLTVWKDEVAGELEATKIAEICPVYGEIHLLLVTAVAVT